MKQDMQVYIKFPETGTANRSFTLGHFVGFKKMG